MTVTLKLPQEPSCLAEDTFQHLLRITKAVASGKKILLVVGAGISCSAGIPVSFYPDLWIIMPHYKPRTSDPQMDSMLNLTGSKVQLKGKIYFMPPPWLRQRPPLSSIK
jgi:hypothetical protein